MIEATINITESDLDELRRALDNEITSPVFRWTVDANLGDETRLVLVSITVGDEQTIRNKSINAFKYSDISRMSR